MDEEEKHKQELIERFNAADSLERVEMLRKGLFAKGGKIECEIMDYECSREYV